MGSVKGVAEPAIYLHTMNKLYGVIEEKFKLQLGKIVIAQSSQSQLRTLLGRRLPYLERFTQEVEDCTEREECEEAALLVDSLPGECLHCIHPKH